MPEPVPTMRAVFVMKAFWLLASTDTVALSQSLVGVGQSYQFSPS
jgi:hypothetical protein